MKRAILSILLACAFFASSAIEGCQGHDMLPKQVNLFIVGPGDVGVQDIGLSLLDLVEKNDPLYRELYGLHIRIVAIANSEICVYHPAGIKLKNWQSRLATSSQPMNWAVFKEKITQFELSNPVFIDCSLNQEIRNSYESLISSGVFLLTLNPQQQPTSNEHPLVIQNAETLVQLLDTIVRNYI